jgi:acyl-CoA hydrolase/RimJ/RimL family protein N-acetyltransferase
MSKPPDVDWQARYADKVETATHAVRRIRHGSRVFIGSGAGEPQSLVRALAARENLDDAEIVHIMTLGVAPYAEPRFDQRFRHNAFFIGANTRAAVAEGRADYTPIFLSEVPALFRTGRTVIDVALIQVSEPDEHGYCSYGVSTDIVKSAAESAHVVIAEVNSQAPRALGDCFIHVRDIDVLVTSDEPILEAPQGEESDLALQIGRHIADLVEDGATLQLGIGQIPDAVLRYLGDRRDLGIHTEMFSDGVLPLIDAGVITNNRKTLHRGKMVAGFVLGSKALYDFVDDNPIVEFHPTEYTNDPFIIAQNERMTSINSAIEVDLTGQVCADSLGQLFYSGIGGQVDFIRGSARSKGGKPIIALPSTAEDGTISRIVPILKPGAGVVTSRGDVHYIVTEYGIAYLHGKTMRERALALVSIAHPKFRPWLLAEAKARHLVYADQIEPEFSTPIYPERLERWVKLKDGTDVFIRPLKMTDEPALRDTFYSLSEESVYHRFFRHLPAMPHARLQAFMRTDYEHTMALVATPENAEDQPILAVARYDLDRRTNLAEVAFVVRDEWQGKGLGTQLFGAIRAAAREQGIAGFTATVLADNVGMLRVFHRAGHPIESQLVDGTYELTIMFEGAPSPVTGPKPPATDGEAMAAAMAVGAGQPQDD